MTDILKDLGLSIATDEPMIKDAVELAEWMEKAASKLQNVAARLRDNPDYPERATGLDIEVFSPQMNQIYYHYDRLVLGYDQPFEQWLHTHKTGGYIPYYTAKEAADRSGLSRTTILNQINKGRIDAVKHGRDWMVSESALQSYLDSRPEDERRKV